MAHPDYYKILGVPRGRLRRRHQEGLPQARPQVPPRPEPRQQGLGGQVQGAHRGQRSAVGRGEAEELRHLRRPGRTGRPRGPWASPSRISRAAVGDRSRTCSAISAAAAGAASGPKPGEDTQHPVRIGFKEAFQGTKLSLSLQRSETCRGLPGLRATCPAPGPPPAPPAAAGASGRRARPSSAPARNAPPAAAPARRRRPAPPARAGAGCPRPRRSPWPSPRGWRTAPGCGWPARARRDAGAAAPGDLYLQIQVEPDPRFERRGPNLYLDLPISFSEAALGTKVEIPTPDGHSTIKIPPGTQGNANLRLKGLGMPIPGQRPAGRPVRPRSRW